MTIDKTALIRELEALKKSVYYVDGKPHLSPYADKVNSFLDKALSIINAMPEASPANTSEISDNEPLFHDLRLRTDTASAFAPDLMVIPTAQAMDLIDRHCFKPEPVDPRENCPWKCRSGDPKCLCAPKPVTRLQDLRDELDSIASASLEGQGIAGRLQAIITKIDEGKYV